MSEEVSEAKDLQPNPKEDIQELRKALKQWESAFCIVHQRKPDKEDIAKAPKDIKDKYHQYFNLKKGSGSGAATSIKSPTLQVQGDVWGAELNKKPKAGQVNSENKKCADASKTSLSKLGAKLSQNLSKTLLPEKLNPHKVKGVFKPHVLTKKASRDDSSTEKTNSDTECHQDGSPLLKGNQIVSDAANDSDEDFSIKGDIFKGAAKLFAGDQSSNFKKVSITAKPRLTFISSGALKQIELTSHEQLKESNDILVSREPAKSCISVDSNNIYKINKKSPLSSDIYKASSSTMVTGSNKLVDHSHISSNILAALKHNDAQHHLEDAFPQCSSSGVEKLKKKAFSEAFLFMDSEDSDLVEQPSKLNETKVQREKTSLADATAEAESLSSISTGSKKPKRLLKGSSSTSKQDSQLTHKDSQFEHEDVKESDSEGEKAPAKTQSRKRKAASLSENFVCLNMKKKGYRRKGAGMTGAQLRKKQWKAKMASRSKSFGSNKCFKCGQEGHWANKCTGQAKNSWASQAENFDVTPVAESEFPSLREAAMMSRGIKGKDNDLYILKSNYLLPA
ncbi:ATP-dependent DNA helicase Q4 [Biomphalaria pfeifferi]|uniref:ATP-dependent DNA helicase Q4 n=1 Tax=Biomphalaria pfeifferi TaxID=112525 RepID=A0AAD8AYY8_BIOPF|nr:ATP-dependent DNA helicase Q4 [Biomphalaria pfeifferi]